MVVVATVLVPPSKALTVAGPAVLALALAMAKQDLTGIGHAQTVLCGLRGGFAEAAAKDTSEPLMHNTEQVYAGITYGKNNLNESFQSEASRGFFV